MVRGAVLAVVGGASGKMCGAGGRGGTLSSRAGNSPLLARSSAHLLGARVRESPRGRGDGRAEGRGGGAGERRTRGGPRRG